MNVLSVSKYERVDIADIWGVDIRQISGTRRTKYHKFYTGYVQTVCTMWIFRWLCVWMEAFGGNWVLIRVLSSSRTCWGLLKHRRIHKTLTVLYAQIIRPENPLIPDGFTAFTIFHPVAPVILNCQYIRHIKSKVKLKGKTVTVL